MPRQLTYFPFAALFCLFLFAGCKDPAIEPDNSSTEETAQQTTENTDWDFGPVTDCDETLSAFELKELWEMMNAKVYHEKHICFTGYVLSNETYGDLVQGSIAFEPFTDEDVIIPAVYCQFTGLNGVTFLDYEVGERIEIMGKLLCIDNDNKHNFMFAKCSLPAR